MEKNIEERVFEKSEYVVSKDTGAWVSALRMLLQLWEEVDGLNGYPDNDNNEFLEAFMTLEGKIANKIAGQIVENMGWCSLPKNMI